MAIAVVIVVGALLLQVRSSQERASSAGDRIDAAIDVGEDSPAVAPRPVDRSLLAKVDDRSIATRLVREPDAMAHLLALAGDLTARASTAAPPLAEPSVLRSESSSHRGELLCVRGVVVSIERPSLVGGSRDASAAVDVRGMLRDPHGERFAFSVIESPTGGGDPDSIVNREVELVGYFFKLIATETAPGEYDDLVPYFVGRRLVALHPALEKNDDLKRIAFHTAKDRTPADMIEWPEDLVLETLNWVRSIAPDRGSGEAVLDVDWTELRRQPEHYRGRIVRVIGRYRPQLEWLRRLDAGASALGRSEFHEGLLKLSDEHLFRWIGFDAAEHATDGSDGARALTLEGVFIKNVAWLNSRGDLVSGPLIVATRLETMPLADEKSIAAIALVITGLAAVCILICLFGIYSDGQKAKQFQRDYLARRRRQLERLARARPPRSGGVPP